MTEAPFKQEKAALSDDEQASRRPETAADGGDYAPQAMLAAAQNGEQEAMETLIQRNEGLIHGIVRRFTDRAQRIGAEYDDLYQLACIGFIKAVSQFDFTLEYRFSTYAVPKMIGEIRRFLRDDGPIKVSRSVREVSGKIEAARESLLKRLGREPSVSEIAAATGLTSEEVAAQENRMPQVVSPDGETDTLESIPDPSQPEETLLDRLALSASVASLPPRERSVISLRYERGLTQQKVALILGVSQVQVSRIERSALEKLRRLLC